MSLKIASSVAKMLHQSIKFCLEVISTIIDGATTSSKFSRILLKEKNMSNYIKFTISFQLTMWCAFTSFLISGVTKYDCIH